MRLRTPQTIEARQGSALALALVTLTLVAGLGFSFLTLAASVTKRQASDVETVQAFYIAEAGLAEAFHAVRAGRGGQLGTAAEPATFGGGLLWVEAVENRDGQIELDAQALFGRARSALRMTVEPVPLDLGFFADEDLVIDSVLMVDGFEAEVGPVAPPPVVDDSPRTLSLLPPPTAPKSYSAARAQMMYQDLVMTLTDPFAERLLSASDAVAFRVDPESPQTQWIASYEDETGLHEEPCLISIVEPVLNGELETLRCAYPWLHLQSFTDVEYLYEGFVEADYNAYLGAFSGVYESVYQTWFDEQGVLRTDQETATTASEGSTLDPADGEGASAAFDLPLGLMGSNGNVSFSLPEGDVATINGDVVPGPTGEVSGLGTGVQVTGSTEARSSAVGLPPVEVPSIPLEPGVTHSDLLPLTIPPGAVGYESLEIRRDAELVLRGPATVVIGDLTLEDGAVMTLDTRNGAVDLYVTGSLDLRPGSDVSTTAVLPSDTTIQVSASQASGDPLVKLEATSSFTGTIYSPQADVLVGATFEVFGGIVARKLKLAPGAQLHAGRGDLEGTPLPKLVSWKLLVIPTAPNLAHPDPFRLYGILRRNAVELGDAHDLDAVWIDIAFLDLGGIRREYSGLESGLDWSMVSEVLKVERRVDFEELKQEAKDARLAMGADERKEEPAGVDDGESDPLQQPGDIHPTIRLGVEVAMSNPTGMSKDEIKAAMEPYVPISSGEARYLKQQAPDFCDHCVDNLLNP